MNTVARHALLLRWRHLTASLTREARDTLWLLAMLALVLLPHTPHLPWWCSLSASLALLWRAHLAWRDAPLPPRWLLGLMLVGTVALTWLTHRTVLGREAGITLVVILTTLKCLELRARRDNLVCLYLGFFLILTQFFQGQGIGQALLMLVSVWGLLTSLVLGQRPLGRPSINDAGKEALRAMLYGLPLMVVLFLLFPRFGPLWSLPRDAQGHTGLSDQLTLGDVAELAQDSAVALRIKFLGKAPPTSSLYFRGPTLDQFDGKQWHPAPPMAGWRPNYTLQGQPFTYEITLEPLGIDVLPMLDGTAQATTNGMSALPLYRNGAQWSLARPLDQRLQLLGMAWPKAAEGPLEDNIQLREWVNLPPGFNPRTLAWAAQLRRQPALAQADALSLASAVLQHIRSGGFRYTLQPGLSPQPGNPHLIDEFWFDRKAGFCEHFASSFAVVMRALDVPARVVLGFQGADLNPIDGQYIVRNSHAHAWVEIWQPGQGWLRVDPTAAAEPDRLNRAPQALPFASLPGPLADIAPNALRRWRNQWDAVNHRWNVWVLQYAQGDQMKLLASIGWESPDWRSLGQALALVMAAMVLIGSTAVWLTRDRQRTTPWQQLNRRTQAALTPLVPWGLPVPTGPSPAAASAWLRAVNTCIDTERQALPATLLKAMARSLRELDSLQYGNTPPSSTQKKHAQRAANDLVQQIETLSRQAIAKCHEAGANSSH